MLSRPIVKRLRPLLLVLLSLFVLFSSTSALAAGRVEWKSKDLQEREGGSWRLEVAFFLGRTPDVAHVPMKFEFQPVAYYERSMVDGDKLLERVVPLDNRQALIESVDVGFMDSGSGKIESRTRFSFKVTRAHGYEAGEYKVTIRDSRNGQAIGTATTLKFKGENEVIDRRAMVFSGEKKKKKEEKKEEKKDDAEAKPEGDKPAASAEEKSDTSASEPSDDSAGNEPAPIKEKPGGCGCRLQPNVPGGSAALAGLFCAVAVLVRRKTRAAR